MGVRRSGFPLVRVRLLATKVWAVQAVGCGGDSGRIRAGFRNRTISTYSPGIIVKRTLVDIAQGGVMVGFMRSGRSRHCARYQTLN